MKHPSRFHGKFLSHIPHGPHGSLPRRWRDVSPADPPPSIAPVPHLPPPPSHRHQGSCRGATGSPGNPPSFAVPTFKGTRAEVEGFLIIRIHIDIVSVYISKAIEVYLLAWNLNMSIYIYKSILSFPIVSHPIHVSIYPLIEWTPLLSGSSSLVLSLLLMCWC